MSLDKKDKKTKRLRVEIDAEISNWYKGSNFNKRLYHIYSSSFPLSLKRFNDLSIRNIFFYSVVEDLLRETR